MLCCLVAGSLSSCKSEPPVDVEVSWRFGAGTCRTAGVVDVRVSLFEFDRHRASATGTAPCVDGHQRLGDVPPGEYTLLLSGVDAAGCETHGARQSTVRVDGDEGVGPILLGLRPRPIVVAWAFGEGLDCMTLSVVQVEAEIQVGDAPPVRGAWLCGALVGRLPEVPAGPARVTLRGLDPAGTTVARAEGHFTESALLPDACAEAFGASLTLEGCAAAGCP